jgi:F-type H+-transporting ATPase subunit delta
MLRGASAEAHQELADRLAGASQTPEVGEELFGVAGVLRGEPALRRVVTDASIEGSAKAALAGNVFGGSVGETTLELVKDAVQRRWTAGRDLADVLELLGVVSLVQSSGDEGGRISDELFEVRRVIDGQADLRSALSDPSRSKADKNGLLRGLFEGKVQSATLLLVGQALDGTHGAIDRGLVEFQNLAAEAKGEKIATVHTARELSSDERERLTAALSRQYGTSVHLQVVLDPEVVGGLRVAIGDDVIDGTVSGKLEDAQRKLAG